MEYHIQECRKEADFDRGDTSSSSADDNKQSGGDFVRHNNEDEISVDSEASIWSKIRKFLPFSRNETSVREAIEELIEEDENRQDQSVESHERALISNILNLRDLPVVDIMIPRADILAVDVRSSISDLLEILTEKPHSRLPVYHDTMDNIVGAVHMKDLISVFAEWDKNKKPKKNADNVFKLKEYLRNVLVVSPAMRVLDLLLQMRQSRVHMAIVIDEYGGTDGLITINDLVEAIVGEMEDEHELEIQPQLVERRDGTILADARYPLDEFEEKFGKFLDDEEREDVGTLGGLVNILAGHVPTRGEVIVHKTGMEFEVLDADPRRVHRLCIRNVYKTI